MFSGRDERAAGPCTVQAFSPSCRIFCLVVTLLLGVSPAEAQDGRALWSSFVPGRASWSSSGKVEGEGQNAAGTALEALQRISSVESYRETLVVGVRLSHYIAGLKIDLPVLSGARWKLYTDLGIGATRLSTAEPSLYDGPDYRQTETYLSFRGLLTLEFAASRVCRVFLTAQEYLYLDDTSVAVNGFDEVKLVEAGSWSFPLTAGLKVQVN